MNSSEKQNPKITPCYPHVIPWFHCPSLSCQAPAPDSATVEVPDSAPQAGADSGAGSVRRPRGPGEAQRPRDGMVLGRSIDFDFYRYRMI